MRSNTSAVEWPTVLLLAVTYALWAVGTTWAASVWLPLGMGLTALAIIQFSSLQHEIIHGHPFPSQRLNDALVFPALMPYVPYERFRTTHLQHHYDPALTDPYDDPESNYQDPAVWARMSPLAQKLLRLNNALLGRMVLGPIIGTVLFVRSDLRLMRDGDAAIRRAWALHGIGVLLVLGWLWTIGSMSVLAYLVTAYLAYAVLKIRTYLEHRAHEAARARTVLVEDRGPLALLFLNNNLHVVHHTHPSVPWYRLPALYAANRDQYLRRNEGYRYANYGEVFRRYFLKAKDPVPHPVWPVRRDAMPPLDERLRAAE